MLFLSYAEEDDETGIKVAGWLTGQGLDVYYWQDPRRRGGRFIEQIERAIGQADAFVALLSPSFVQSPWCGQERELALQREADLRARTPGAVFIHVLKISETPSADTGFLRSYDWGDLTGPPGWEQVLSALVDRLGHTQLAEATHSLTSGEVIVGDATPSGPSTPSAIRPFIFNKVSYLERRDLAQALSGSWELAAQRLFSAMSRTSAQSLAWRSLREWLEQFLNAGATDVEDLYVLIDDVLLPSSHPPDVKLLELILWLDPTLPPVYRGRSLTTEELTVIAERVTFDEEPAGELVALIGDLYLHDLLPRLARTPGGSGLRELDAAWRELDGRFQEQAQNLPGKSQAILADPYIMRLRAALLFLALNPIAHAERLREQAPRSADLLQPSVLWYDQICGGEENDNPVGDAILIALFPFAIQESARLDRLAIRQRETTRRNEEAWAEHEDQRLAGSPSIRCILVYISIMASLMAALFGVEVFATDNTLLEFVSGLVGAISIILIAVSEMRLVKLLGSEYPDIKAFTWPHFWFPRKKLGRISLTLLISLPVLFIILPILILSPFITYIVMGFLHWQSWLRRRKSWLNHHAQERINFLSSTQEVHG